MVVAIYGCWGVLTLSIWCLKRLMFWCFDSLFCLAMISCAFVLLVGLHNMRLGDLWSCCYFGYFLVGLCWGLRFFWGLTMFKCIWFTGRFSGISILVMLV